MKPTRWGIDASTSNLRAGLALALPLAAAGCGLDASGTASMFGASGASTGAGGQATATTTGAAGGQPHGGQSQGGQSQGGQSQGGQSQGGQSQGGQSQGGAGGAGGAGGGCVEGAPCATGVPGACATGTLSCAGGATCVAPAPGIETCNGVDDDCNGVPDDGPAGAGQPCATGQPGVCATGTTTCAGGVPGCQPTAQPSLEQCNGLDDDCDGVPDQGDPGGGVACQTGMPGLCGPGATACQNGVVVCAQITPAGVEQCNGLDDDCDGVADDGNPGGGAPCATGQLGACATGTATCTNGVVACAASVSPTAETCDGVDSDCNGLVDDVAITNKGTFNNVSAWSATLQNTGVNYATVKIGAPVTVSFQWKITQEAGCPSCIDQIEVGWKAPGQVGGNFLACAYNAIVPDAGAVGGYKGVLAAPQVPGTYTLHLERGQDYKGPGGSCPVGTWKGDQKLDLAVICVVP